MAENHHDDDKTHTHIPLTKDTMVGHYRIVEKIGAGGMGEVYLAEDTELGRKIALKFLPSHLCQDEDCRARFKREAQAAAKLDHPNIVTVHEVGEYQGKPYFAMAHVEGQSLKEFSSGKELSVEQILELGIQISEGLQAAHDKGITHRDIKPSNVLIDSHGRARIVDFGLASVVGKDQLTKTGSTLGTIGYMSPEQVRGQEINHRTDLFSLGVVLYELITKQNPFKRDSEAATLKAVSDDLPEPLARFKAGIPDDLQRIVSKLLEKDPQVRYQSAVGIISDLKLLKRDSGPVAPPPATTPKRFKQLLIPFLVAAIAVLLIVFKPWNVEIKSTYTAVAAENRLAIMYFDNLVDPTDSLKLGEIIANLLITDISESDYVQVVSSQRLYDILKQLGHEGEKKIGRDIATKIAEKANARRMLMGSILNIEPEIILTAQLIDVESGDAIASQKIEGQPGERIFPLVDKLTAEIKADMLLPARAMAEEDRPVMEYTTNSLDAYRCYVEGLIYVEKYYVKEAEESFRKAIQYDSTFAVAYMMLLDYTSGVEKNEILRKMNQYADKASQRERLFIKAYNAYHATVRDSEGYVKYLSEILQKYPDDKQALYYLAWHYNQQMQEYEKAKELCLKLIQYYPTTADAYNNLAYIYTIQENYDSAVWAMNKFVEMADPDEANPYDSRGELYAFHGEIEKAIASFQKALEIKPDFEMSLFRLGHMYLYKGDYVRAESLYQITASQLEPFSRAAGRNWLVKVSLYQGKFEKAMQQLETAIQTDLIELGARGRWLQKKILQICITGNYLHDIDKALFIGDSLLSLDEQLTNHEEWYRYLLMEMAWLCSLKGDFNKADSLLNRIEVLKSFSLGPDYMALRLYDFTDGLISFMKGDYARAIKVFEDLHNYYPLFMIRVFLARSYLEAGILSDAVIKFEDALKRYDVSRAYHPAFAVLAYYWAGQAYEASGWNDKAIVQYETFLDIWKNADPGIEEINDARKRLAHLKSLI